MELDGRREGARVGGKGSEDGSREGARDHVTEGRRAVELGPEGGVIGGVPHGGGVRRERRVEGKTVPGSGVYVEDVCQRGPYKVTGEITLESRSHCCPVTSILKPLPTTPVNRVLESIE